MLAQESYCVNRYPVPVIPNVERGRDSRPETLKAIRLALNREGVLIGFSRNNGLATVSIGFAADDSDEE